MLSLAYYTQFMRCEPILEHVATGLKVTILVSSYHNEVTSNLVDGACAAFIEAGGKSDDCKCITVSGAWELPVVAKKIASNNACDAIIALGCIIAGETTHDQVIGNAIAHGLMHIALEWQHPVSMGVLTCQNLEQALARAGGSRGNKGTESMHAALATIATLKGIS